MAPKPYMSRMLSFCLVWCQPHVHIQLCFNVNPDNGRRINWHFENCLKNASWWNYWCLSQQFKKYPSIYSIERWSVFLIRWVCLGGRPAQPPLWDFFYIGCYGEMQKELWTGTQETWGLFLILPMTCCPTLGKSPFLPPLVLSAQCVSFSGQELSFTICLYSVTNILVEASRCNYNTN